jgi:endonuclease-3
VTEEQRARALETYRLLRKTYPDADCELEPRDPFQLLVAVVLSAQTTDVAVNKVLPGLFAAYPTPELLSQADPEQDVQPLIKTIGMYRQKARNIVGLSKMLVGRFDGRVPRSLDELVALPGVGRKTANVVLGVAYGIAAGVVVDTHVARLAQRLGWSEQTVADRISRDLEELFPKDEWIMLSHVLIFHGRRVCSARKPGCDSCVIADRCPSAGHAEHTGRKTSRSKRSSRRSSGTS